MLTFCCTRKVNLTLLSKLANFFCSTEYQLLSAIIIYCVLCVPLLSTDCVFSPDEQTIVTGTSVRKGMVC